MKRSISNILTVVITITLAILGLIFVRGQLSELQLDTLNTLLIVSGISMAYCFIVGEITVKSGMNPRLIVMAILITLWGVRLTLNFAK